MKKYNVVWKHWTGNCYLDGRCEYGNEIPVRTNNLDYIFEVRDKHFSEIDTYTGKIHLYDLNTGAPVGYEDLLAM